MDSERFSIVMDTSNPWSGVDSSLVPLRNALILGERTGHINKRSDYDVEKLQDEVQEKMPSCRLIKLLRETTAAKKEINKIHLEIQQRMQDKETQDITHFSSLEDKIKVIKGLNSHIESIIECKSQLLVRLQQPFVGDFIKLEAQYHKFAAALFPQIAPLLADLNTHLENISWTKTLTFSDGKLETMLSELNSVLASLQTNFQSLCQMRGSMGALYQHDSQTVHH
ncbi:uncharacterized protein LOC132556403 [Ylistrum balloti]|uniref:uncharacterized protein LOC132556403 n=1 Tax=Ylistrum balloti TaxID=509963 RepID=UPI002905AB5D|nr:uncharacterized protein LOC132556403 [Ylistrum balloti]